MIDIQAKIHDKFSIEFKVGYVADPGPGKNDFAMNTWLFMPNSLDINSSTYGPAEFYRDVKSNTRLITPVFLLREMVSGQAIPLANIEKSFRELALDPSKANIAEYEYQIKMFMAIFKSSVRDEIIHITSSAAGGDLDYMCGQYLANVREIAERYRNLRYIVNVPTTPSDVLNYFYFGDEFMSSTIEKQTFRLIDRVQGHSGEDHREIVAELSGILKQERLYRIERGYPVVETDSADGNRAMIFRQGVLKKYIESDLFLKKKTKRDGVAMEQVYLSLAAGISMIFATAIAFSFQQKYGNFTMPLFVALVVSYMLKDRIKEAMRSLFAHRLRSKYFDNRTSIDIKERNIGWIKEGMDFITDDKVPGEVMELRSRSPLLQAENRMNDEKIILYRKMVRLNEHALDTEDKYYMVGINDIVRFHLSGFVQKMDNPLTPLSTFDQQGNIRSVWGEKIYYLNFVLQLIHGPRTEYKRYRIAFNRDGVQGIEEFK